MDNTKEAVNTIEQMLLSGMRDDEICKELNINYGDFLTWSGYPLGEKSKRFHKARAQFQEEQHDRPKDERVANITNTILTYHKKLRDDIIDNLISDSQ